jgi:hypothetical protein
MSTWHPPPGMTGNADLVRVSSRTARADERACPASGSAKARPGIWLRGRANTRRPTRPDFALGPFMTALDLIEHAKVPPEAALKRAAAEPGRLPAHPGLMEWTQDAVRRYLAAAPAMACIAEGVVLEPTAHEWVYRWSGALPGTDHAVYEITAWGRRYRNPNGSIRELRLPRVGSARAQERDPAEVAVAAYVAAFGMPADRPQRWSDQFRAHACPERVTQVRVVEYGCADGLVQVLFDGTRSEAEAAFRDLGSPRLREAVSGRAERPGEGCADCKLLTACRTLPRVPGLLGILGAGQPLRTWSVTNGRDYAICPARDHLRRLHLPRAGEYGQAARRGKAVHARIEELHRRHPAQPCTEQDLRPDLEQWQQEWQLDAEQATLGARQLAWHLPVCPLAPGTGVGQVRPEPSLALHDPLADVIVLAKPDLLYQDRGAWVWRETKTDGRTRARDTDLLEKYPQTALAAVMLAADVLGGEHDGSRVELEILRPDGPDIHLLDPHDPAVAGHAREIVRDLAAAWHGDLLLDPRPGPWCADCEVSRWCTARPQASERSAA